MYKSVFAVMLSLFAFNVNANSFSFDNYFPSIDTGEVWNYSGAAEFSLSLSSVDQGPFAGFNKLGNDKTGIIFSVDAGVLRWHSYNNQPLEAQVVFDQQFETNKLYKIDGREVVFVSVPEYTVEAGTFNNVIAMVWLHPGYLANAKNAELNIDREETIFAASDIDYYAKGVGLIGYEAINVVDGSVAASYGLSSVNSIAQVEAIKSRHNDSVDTAALSYQVSPFKK